jgi:diguanylate cyclase (GGDEF)-like protein/PAS domain S-box-containing protein
MKGIKIFSINKSLLETIWPFCFIVMLLIFLSIASMNTLSSVRAFVSGESLWSKSQKESVRHLHDYAKTHAETDYQLFLNAIAVPLNDKVARLELQKSRPNLNKAKEALIKGKNHPEDVEGMARLFLMYHRTSLMEPAITAWKQGDQLVSELMQLAVQIHDKVQSGQATAQELDQLLNQVEQINAALTPIADQFSNSLGEASRKTQLNIVMMMIAVTLILTALGIIFTRRIVLRNLASANALETSEERWKFALEGAKDGVWDWNMQTNKLLISKQWNNMLGYEDETLEITNLQWEQQIHPEDLTLVLDALEAYIQGTAEKYAIEHRMRCKTGLYKWVLTRGMIVDWDKDGSPKRMVGTHSDIDPQKHIEATLRESDASQRALLEAMVDGVFVAQDYRFVFANPTLPKMLGYGRDEFNNMPFDKIIAPESLSLWRKRFAARINTGEEPPRHYQVKFLLKGGKDTIFLDLHASKVIFRGQPSVLGVLRDISKQKEAEDIIWQQANFDGLTALPNRRMFRDRLEQEIKKSERTNAKFAVMFLDLDRFKEVNDSLGHDVGDKLLQEAALRLRKCVRDSDTVARLGGDEFVLLFIDIQDVQSLERISKNILQSLSAPFQLGLDPVYISASMGITLYPKDANDFEDLLKNADQAMYAAKAEGRNRFSYFTPSMQAAVQLKMRLANDLRQAIERNEFKLVYQPIIEVDSGEICKAEALLRWHHPTRGLINPVEFIPVAEETGLIMELGEWVFKEAVAQLVKWRDLLDEEFQISINKSPIQFRQPHSNWVEYMRNSGLPGRSLVVEITESLLLDANDNVGKKLLEFRDAGINVAIDDFGTGYSSLSYLKKFDIDFIKIDQSFIGNLSHDSNDMGLCEAIILMAHKLGMKVIAEGVETEQQFQLLADMQCDYVQGFLIARPLSVEDFESLINSDQVSRKHIRSGSLF